MRCTNCGEDIALNDDLEAIVEPLTFLCMACALDEDDEDDEFDFYGESVCIVCGATLGHRINCPRGIASALLTEIKNECEARND